MNLQSPNGNTVAFTKSCSTDSYGNLTSCTITVTAAPDSSQSFTADGVTTASTFTAVSEWTFTSSGALPSSITLTGTGLGFGASEASVDLEAVNSGTVAFTSTCSTNSYGNLTSCTITVTASPDTAQSFTAGGVSTTSTFTAVSEWTFTPSGAFPSSITLTGAGLGFGASELSVNVQAVNSNTVAFTSSCSTDSYGNLTCTITVTAAPHSAQSFTADGSGTASSFTATSTFTFTPGSGVLPAALTLTGGIGFAASEISPTVAAVDSAAVTFTLGACSTNSYGNLSCSISVTHAPDQAESFTVDTIGTASTFTALASQSAASPSAGHVGSTTTAQGTGFGASLSITFTLAGVTAASTCRTDTTGTFSCTVTIPAEPAGIHLTLEATDGSASADTTFTLNPQLTLSPNSGNVGSSTTATGTAFGATVPITLFSFDGVTVSCTAGALETDGNGNFSCTFNVPAVPGGVQTLEASDGSNSAPGTYTVTASFLDTPQSGGAFGIITITGTGYPASTNTQSSFLGVVILAVDSCTVGAVYDGNTFTTNASGQFSCTLTVPSVVAGFYQLTAGSVTSGHVFTVTNPALFTPGSLDSAETWYVNVTGAGCAYALSCSGSGTHADNIAFYLPNGTYTFTVASGGYYYAASPGANSLAVSGTTTTIQPGGTSSQEIIWTAQTQTATFTTTLPTVQESWFVNATIGIALCAYTGATCTGTNSGTSIVLTLFNGTYAYTVASGGFYYAASPGTGSITVSGTGAVITPASASTQPVTWAAQTQTVTFSTTLPTAQESWFVNATTGGTRCAYTGATCTGTNSGTSITLTLFNGTYTYTVVSGGLYYAASPGTGSVTVTGSGASPPTVSVSWVAQTQTVTFSTTLPTVQESWFVNATIGIALCAYTGATCTGTNSGTSIVLTLFNGTYAYTVASGGFYYAASPGTGSIAVTGAGATPSPVVVTWAAQTQTATFTESGLSGGETWSLNATTVLALCAYTGADCAVTGVGTSFDLTLFNGSYSYTAESGGFFFAPSPAAGTITVTGAGAIIQPSGSSDQTVVFTLVTYAVTFTETGLPANMTWAVAGNSRFYSTTLFFATSGMGGGSLEAYSTNGTFSYTIQDVAGWHLSSPAYTGTAPGISGGPVAGPALVFYQVTYTVTMSEVGLPAGMTWGVEINGTFLFNVTLSDGTGSLVTELPNGTFTYAIQDVPGWHQNTITPYLGVSSVSGAPVNALLVFTQVTYVVTLTETGLPTGLAWTVELNGSFYAGAAPNQIVEALPNGTYTYSVGDVPGWHMAQPYSGGGEITGAPVNLLFSFVQVTYAVTYMETGLPAGVLWTVTLNGTLITLAAPNPITALLPNGTYTYEIGDVQGWHQTTVPYSGSGTINDPGLNVTIAFTQVEYAVTFAESGLPSGLTFGVIINGTLYTALTPNVVTTMIPNGTFTFQVQDVA
ncbi:MAG: beta strand repeat-containing protein, partial [Thermoplasmata archaeon]